MGCEKSQDEMKRFIENLGEDELRYRLEYLMPRRECDDPMSYEDFMKRAEFESLIPE